MNGTHGVLLLSVLLSTSACASGAGNSSVATASAVDVTPTSAPTTATPPASTQDPVSPPVATSGCRPWGGPGFSVTAAIQGSAANWRTEIAFDDGTGVVALNDIQRSKKRTLTLSAADHRALTKDLLAICPEEKEFSAECAPGGCTSIEVKQGSSTTRLQQAPSAGKVWERLARLFPELSKQ